MTANTQHIIIRDKWRCWSVLLLLLLSACSDYEYSIYDPLSPNYIDKVAPVAEEVDLGLSVNWASWNVGATAPEEYGNYYAWGEVRPRNNYTKDSYIYYNGDGKYTDIGENICGTLYDVAHVKWGDGWRMPTKDECNELINKCSWTWETINGTPGQMIIGPNGNSIFLPAAGHISGTKKESLGLYGNYWTGSLILENDDYSYYLYFGLQGPLWSYWHGRFYGFSVRPVKDKEFKMSIAELLKTGEGTAATVQGTIVAKHTRGILLYDETGYILVNMEEESGDTRHTASNNATRSASSYTEGDVVTVEGVVCSDAGLLQFPSISKIQKVGSAEVVHPEPEVWNSTAFYNYFDNISVRYVKYTGVLSKEGNDYIVTVSDSTTTAVGQITYPASDLVDANDEGREVQVIGYTIGYTDDKYVRTMVTSVKVVGGRSIDERAVAEAVDLGLSVKWASWNVGATAPEEYGGYYAWGEKWIKHNYTKEDYSYYNSSTGSFDDISSEIGGRYDYDVAYTRWGSDWHMPSEYAMKELVNECSWEWTSINGVNGQKVTGPNGNSIFLPAAGYRKGTELIGHGSGGLYWSSTRKAEFWYVSDINPYILNFYSRDVYIVFGIDPYDGLPVRPVKEENN